MFGRSQKSEGNFRWHELGTYNAERARGIVHTDEWRKRMEREQAIFDEWAGREFGVAATTPPPSPPVVLNPGKVR